MIRLKRRKAPRFGTVKPDAPIRSEGHKKWVRGFSCCVEGLNEPECGGHIEAAHVRRGTDGSMSSKPSDCWVIPLCGIHHARQHQVGEASFEKLYGINMKSIAQDLASRSPHLRKLNHG